MHDGISSPIHRQSGNLKCNALRGTVVPGVAKSSLSSAAGVLNTPHFMPLGIVLGNAPGATRKSHIESGISDHSSREHRERGVAVERSDEG